MPGVADQPDWLAPASVEIEPPGEMRFLVQPRWAAGPYLGDDLIRRRDMPGFTELEVKVPLPEGSLVGVVYLLPYYETSTMVATCFNDFFQPLRRLLYEPGNDRRRARLWERLPEVRPLFMAVNKNGLQLRLNDLALIHYPDPSTGKKKNLIVSVDRSRMLGNALDENLLSRCAAVFDASVLLFEEALIPLDIEALHRGLEVTDLVDTSGSAAKWVFDNAGKIKDVIELAEVLIG